MTRWWRDLWAFAAALALGAAIVLRWRRGQVAMVSGAAAPAIRLLALVIVFVQGCADRLRGGEQAGEQAGAGDGGQGAGSGGQVPSDTAQETGTNEQVPKDMVEGPARDDGFPLASEAALERCLALQIDRGWGVSGYKRTTRLLAVVPAGAGQQDPAWDDVLRQSEVLRDEGIEAGSADAFIARLRAHVEARRAGRAQTAAELLALLGAAEALPVYDAWLAGYVWRMSAGAAGPRAELMARIERHLRVHHALLKGQVETGPVEFTAWRSKAAPPAGWRGGLVVPRGLLAAARAAYPQADAGTWETAGTLVLEVIRADGLALVRRGQRVALTPGQVVTLRRLDLLEARGPALLRHAALGELSFGAGASASAWDVGERLGAAGVARVQAQVDAALAGDAAALRWLEGVLPAAHAAIRRAVAQRPDAPGAPGLRTALALFEE